MLVNLTNDAWFDASVAPRQHMRNSVLRTVENRVPLVRAANTGVTCIIEPSGKIAAQWVDAGGRTDTPGVLWTDVSVPADSNPLTFYARYGDMYGLACVAIAVLWFATSIPWRRKTNLGNLKSTL